MMKFLKLLLVSVLVVPVSWAGTGFEVEAVEIPYQRWYFKNLQVVEQDNVIQVKGKMNAINRSGLPSGHIDIAAYSPHGELVAETTTKYLPGALSKRTKRKGGVKFSAMFDQPIPAGSVFKVAFHKDDWLESKPVHNENIAR